MIRREIDLV